MEALREIVFAAVRVVGDTEGDIPPGDWGGRDRWNPVEPVGEPGVKTLKSLVRDRLRLSADSSPGELGVVAEPLARPSEYTLMARAVRLPSVSGLLSRPLSDRRCLTASDRVEARGVTAGSSPRELVSGKATVASTGDISEPVYTGNELAKV